MAARVSEYIRRVFAADTNGSEFGDIGGRLAHHARPPRKLYRMSEIAQHLGLTRQTLHNYLTIGLITEDARTPGGQRLFDESVFERLALIQQMKHAYRLHEIRRMFDAGPPAADVSAEAVAVAASAPATPAHTMLERSQELIALSHHEDPPAPVRAPAVVEPDSNSKATLARDEHHD